MYFGSFDPDYSRNRIIIKGLIENKVNVFQCKSEGLIFFRYFKLIKDFLKEKNNFDSVVVGFPGHYDVPLAFILGKIFKKKVFFDIFASTYETYVLDRKVAKKNSFKSRLYYFVDWLGLHLATYVITDTLAHGKFYSHLYKINPEKQIVVYVGSDDDYFYPRNIKEETDVLFYGSYQPLQGAAVIIEAAAHLPSVKFKMIGDGQTRKAAENIAKELMLNNVEFVDWMPLERLAEEISKAKICLGIFGKTQKANIVIPNKVYDYLASAKPVITAKTEATQELLETDTNSVLTELGNSQDLVLAIRDLIKNANNRLRIAKAGNNLSKTKLIPNYIVRNLVSRLNEK